MKLARWFYPRRSGIYTFLAPTPISLGLLAAGLDAPVVAGVGVASHVISAVIALATWPFDSDIRSKNRTADELKGVIRKPFKLQVKPEGEYVVIRSTKKLGKRTPILWPFFGELTGQAVVDQRRFHAENEAEAAHEFVAEARNPLELKSGNSPEAEILAKVLKKA